MAKWNPSDTQDNDQNPNSPYPIQAGVTGDSIEAKALVDRIVRIAKTDIPVLIRGEVGSEVDQVAEAIHLNSPRSHGQLVAESCAVLRDPYVVRHLFGHLRGAFTGASSAAEGLFAIADGGTLYLQEVADLAPEAQACLLRVLETGEYRPLGAARVQRADFRIVASTAADLGALVRDGQFRGELYYRLRGALLDIPPLRTRRFDVLTIARDEIAKAKNDETTPTPRIRGRDIQLPEEFAAALMAHDWPGNVRELRQELQQVIAICGTRKLRSELFQFRKDPPPKAPRRPSSPRIGLRSRMDEFETRAVREALIETGGNKAEAARRLGITRRTLYRRLAQMRGTVSR